MSVDVEIPVRDMSSCPYFQRMSGTPGYETGSCGWGCYDEPSCITDEPEGGWPERQAHSTLTVAELRALLEGQPDDAVIVLAHDFDAGTATPAAPYLYDDELTPGAWFEPSTRRLHFGDQPEGKETVRAVWLGPVV